MKLNEMFLVIQGHQITDEEIYKNQGEIPVLTGRNEIKGFWNGRLVKEDNLPCITYPTKANSGEAYVQQKIFDANNTAVLIPKPNWKNKINLSWFAYKLSKLFLDIQTSKEGVSYLNKEIVEEVDFKIPETGEQEKEYKSIHKLLVLKSKIKSILKKIVRIKEADLILEYKEYQVKDYSVDNLFDSIGGNAGLTEQYVYQNLQSSEERKYVLLTGSILIDKDNKIPLLAKPKNKTKKIKVFSGEGIHVIRKGLAGRINYLENGDYTSNDDAYILKMKKTCPLSISLKWFTKVYAKKFIQFASQSDNGTWNKTAFFDDAKFDIPSLKEQQIMLKKFENLDKYEQLCNKILDKIKEILNKEVTYN